MATITAPPPADRKATERKFYSRMALFLSCLVHARLRAELLSARHRAAYPRPNPTLPASVMLHGGVFTLWMLAIVAQTQLISARKHARPHAARQADRAARRS